MFTVKGEDLASTSDLLTFKNISCLRLSEILIKILDRLIKFKNISCLRLRQPFNLNLHIILNLKTFHVYG